MPNPNDPGHPIGFGREPEQTYGVVESDGLPEQHIVSNSLESFDQVNERLYELISR